MVELVSERSARDVQHERHIGLVRHALLTLTANLMRVTRGAGKEWDLVHNAVAFLKAVAEYQEQVGRSPSLGDLLSVNPRWEPGGERRAKLNIADRRRMDAEDLIICGALQIVASRLLGQPSTEAQGGRELHEGVRDLEAAREEFRRQFERPNARPLARRRARTVAKKGRVK